MKKLISILKDPKAGGQIVLPRRLLENMFENISEADDTRACILMLLKCAYTGSGGDGLQEGEMDLSHRRLAGSLRCSGSRVYRLLLELQKAGVVRMSPGGTRMSWTNYHDICRMGRGVARVPSVVPLDEEAARAFDEFWTLYHSRSRQIPRDRYQVQREWAVLTDEERRMAVDRMEDYFRSLSNMDYVRTGANYLRCRSFL